MNDKIKTLSTSLILGLNLFFGLLALFFSLSLKAPSPAYAAGLLRYVAPAPLGSDDSNTCLNQASPCATVQHAVDQANPDDEIRIAAGIYGGVFTRTGLTQVVYISKSLTIRGGYTATNWSTSNPAANPTTLNAQALGRVFNIVAALPSPPISVTIEGLRIVNGNAKGQSSPSGAESGGGIHGYNVMATLKNNFIAFNNGSQIGGGVLLFGDGSFTIVNNTIFSNTVETSSNHARGGGLALAILPGSDAQVHLSGNVIQGNIAKATNPTFDAGGGGVYILAGDHITFNGNIIRANRAEMTGAGAGQGGGGGIYFSGSKANLTNSVIANNLIVGQGTGAGVHVFGGELSLLHPTIARNSGGDGSGITIQQPGLVTLTNGILTSHRYGITVSTGSKATLNGVLWFNNLSGNAAGAGVINLSSEIMGNPFFDADGYHLGPGSAAIDKASNTGLGTDIDGEARVGFPDLGADEASEFSSYFLPIIVRINK